MPVNRPSYLLDCALGPGSVPSDVPLDVSVNELAERRSVRAFLERRFILITGQLPRGDPRVQTTSFAASLLDRQVVKLSKRRSFGYSSNAASMKKPSGAGSKCNEAQPCGLRVENDEAVIASRNLKGFERAFGEVQFLGGFSLRGRHRPVSPQCHGRHANRHDFIQTGVTLATSRLP